MNIQIFLSRFYSLDAKSELVSKLFYSIINSEPKCSILLILSWRWWWTTSACNEQGNATAFFRNRHPQTTGLFMIDGIARSHSLCSNIAPTKDSILLFYEQIRHDHHLGNPLIVSLIKENLFGKAIYDNVWLKKACNRKSSPSWWYKYC